MPTVNRREIEFTLEGAEASKAILEPIYFDDVMEYFEVMPQVTSEKKMAYAGVMEDVLQKAISCGMRPKGKFPFYERTISTEIVGAYVPQCFDEALNTAYTSLYKRGLRMTDLSGTVFGEILVTRTIEAIKKHKEKLAFFGNKASSDENINLVDGIWTYIFDLVATDAIPYIDTDSGTPLTAGDAVAAFDKVWKAQPNVLKALPPSEKIMFVSGPVFEQYQTDLEEGLYNSEAYTAAVEEGGLGGKYRNIEVRPMWDWERYGKEYLETENNNLILLTTRDNLCYATDVESNDTMLEVWFDRDSEKNKVRTRFRFGFNYKLAEFLVAGF